MATHEQRQKHDVQVPPSRAEHQGRLNPEGPGKRSCNIHVIEEQRFNLRLASRSASRTSQC